MPDEHALTQVVLGLQPILNFREPLSGSVDSWRFLRQDTRVPCLYDVQNPQRRPKSVQVAEITGVEREEDSRIRKGLSEMPNVCPAFSCDVWTEDHIMSKVAELLDETATQVFV